MKLAHAVYNDQSSPALDEGEFTVENNSTFFYVTIAGLAQDKVRYPVRELCTNAYDTKAPFEVHFPTPFNPTFRVRDFGPGLSRDQVRIVYTRIFKSTKDEDNDAVGGLGLGCKSPFAYLIDMASGGRGGGSYNVNSYQNGTVSSYVMSMGANGKPCWKLLAEEPTDQANGLEVYFAVRREDIARFQEARDVLWSFDPQPKIFPTPNWRTPEVQARGNGWVQYKDSTVPFYGPQVQMGCVMYPIDFNLIDKVGFPWAGHPIVFMAPIGTVSVSPSREGLSYDERTIKTLKAITDEFERDTMTQIQSSLSADPSYMQACASWGTNRWGLDTNIYKYLEQKMTYNGRPVRATFAIDVMTSGLKLCRTIFSAENRFENEVKKSRHGGNTTAVWPRDILERKVVIQRKTNRSDERMQLAGLTPHEKILWVRHATDFALNTFLDTFDLKKSDCVDLDAVTLPKLPKGVRSSVKRRTCKAWVITVGDDGLARGGEHTSKKVSIDLDDDCSLFIVSESSGWRRGRTRNFFYGMNTKVKRTHINYVHNDIERMVKSGDLNPGDRITVFPPDAAEKFDDIDGWEPFGLAFLDSLMRQLEGNNITLDGDLSSLPGVLGSSYLKLMLANPLPEDIRQFMQDVVDFRNRTVEPLFQAENIKRQEILRIITEMFGADAPTVPTTKASEPFEARFADLKTKYRGLKVLLQHVKNEAGYYHMNADGAEAAAVASHYLTLEGENA